MNRRTSPVRWAAIFMLTMTFFLTTVELVRYASFRASFPSGMKIAGVPVGGLTYETAAERLVQVYQAPLELLYGDARIQVRPATLGFQLKLENMLAAADKQRVAQSFWTGFWNYLWNRPISSQDIPLQAEFDDQRLQNFLENEIAVRYDQPSAPPMPIAGESGFYPGQAGTEINYEVSLQRIREALISPNSRVVRLEIQQTQPPRPTIDMLEYLLKDIINTSTFDGLIELYFKDLQNGLVMHFIDNRMNEEEIPLDVAYSSWSTIKIPVDDFSFSTAFRTL